MPTLTLDGQVVVDVVVQTPPTVTINQTSANNIEVFVPGPQGPKGDKGDTGTAAVNVAQTWTKAHRWEPDADFVPITIKSNVAQTADLMQWTNNAGATLAKIQASGSFITTGVAEIQGTYLASNVIRPYNAPALEFRSTDDVTRMLVRADQIGFAVPVRPMGQNPAGIPLSVRGEASQTADLQQWQDSAGAVLSRVYASGNVASRTALIGDTGHGDNYPGFVHRDSTDKVNSYAILNDLAGNTYVNAKSGQFLRFRISNNGRGAWGANGFFVGREAQADGSLHVEPLGTNQTAILVRGLATQFAVTNKSLTANVATLTTASAHGYRVGNYVDVGGVDATFDGRYVITSIPTTTTLTYDKVAADVVSVAATGTVNSYTQGSDLQSWQDSIGRVLARVDRDGLVHALHSFTTGSNALFVRQSPSLVYQLELNTFHTLGVAGIGAGADGTIALRVSSQDSVNKTALSVAPATGTTVPVVIFSGQGSQAAPILDIKAGAGQTGNFIRFFDSAGNIVSHVNVAGHFYEGSRRVIGAFGQHDPHTAYNATGFDGPSDFGSRFIQGTAAGPAIPGASQYYNFALGLGSEYTYAQYAMQWAVPRVSQGGNPYLSFRYREGGAWGGWHKVYAGYADTAGTATPSNDANLVHKDGTETITGAKTFNAGTAAFGGLSVGNDPVVNGWLAVGIKAATNMGAVIRAAASQTADLQQWQDSAGGVLSRVLADGKFKGLFQSNSGTINIDSNQVNITTGGTYPNGGAVRLAIGTSATNFSGIVIQGVASQSADLQQWQDSAGTVLARVAPNGDIYVGSAKLGSTPTNMVTTDTVQTITAAKTFSGANLSLSNLATPSGVTVTPQGTAGTTTYGYRVAAVNNVGITVASATVTTTTGNAILDAVNFNRVAWTAVTGATAYRVYGRTSGSELFIAEIAGTSYDDTGAIVPAGALPGGPAGTTLTIQAWESQSGNLQQWSNSAGAVLASIGPGGQGRFNAAGLYSSAVALGNITEPNGSIAVIQAQTQAAGYIGLIVRGFASQVANLTQWQDSAGNRLAQVRNDGLIGAPYFANQNDSGPYIKMGATTASLKDSAAAVQLEWGGAAGVVMFGTTAMRAKTGQTTDLAQWQDSAGNVLARVANDGTIYKGSTAVGGNAADTEIMAIMGAF